MSAVGTRWGRFQCPVPLGSGHGFGTETPAEVCGCEGGEGGGFSSAEGWCGGRRSPSVGFQYYKTQAGSLGSASPAGPASWP